jgi:hypothetical protein
LTVHTWRNSQVTITDADMNGGTIDNTVIGGSTPAAGSFTTITGSGDMNIDSGTLFVDASENRVGIGTSSPTGKLDVFTNSSRYQRFTSSTADLELVSSNSSTPVLYIKGTGTADLVNVFDDTTEVFTIFDGGKVEVSLSASTGTYFEGGGTGNSAEARKLLITSSTTTNTGDTHTLNAESSTGNVAFATTNTERMRIDSGGDVSFRDSLANEAFYWDASEARLGIGTTNPSATLHAEGSNQVMGSNGNFYVRVEGDHC